MTSNHDALEEQVQKVPFKISYLRRVEVDGARPEWVHDEPVDNGDGSSKVTSIAGQVVATTRVERSGQALTATTSLTNRGDQGVSLSCLQPLSLELSESVDAVHGFSSSWGLEYEPMEFDPETELVLAVLSGRSSQGADPWLAVESETGSVVVSPHWSGNWQILSTPLPPHGHRLTVGLHPDDLSLRLSAGETIELPAVSVSWGDSTAEASAELVREALTRVPAGPPLLTEWNHWWPYEDQEITEDVFLDNAGRAAELGLEVAVLDAGWFGDSAVDSNWVEQRGDWHLVNLARFPHGLTWLADETRRRGIDFGIWIEAEAVGVKAELRRLHPELMATSSAVGSEPAFLGYVCLGSPAARDFVTDTVRRLITSTRARWIKWDFNLDPGLGCDRDDHGHLPGEGLVRHYEGLYRVFDMLKAEFPDTVFEACSSGGLRIDLGLAEHVDCLFLSDPDWTEHHLACLWGAARLLPPRQILHWVQSEWRGEHRFQKVDYSGSLISAEQFDAKVQAAMLHRFGIAARLTEMRPDLLDRLAQHVRAYQDVIRPILERGVLVPLGAQPLREEKGHRLPAFQLTSGDEHVVAAFRLPPAGGWEPVRPLGLDPSGTYRVTVLDLGASTASDCDGATLLADGIPLPADRTSTLVHLTAL
ncbi:alpha-galactosidase [Microlunatus panaciterrae]|uniref:Alpha-galactosidase n=1 Tax=Microlunatus panaciterrae TaxID=400768 RepID=A0ABS2RFB1_9ACTN|nr:alpha-galactosidase [Microlunatus panaciterrae]MBM7797681.1 alpha-galactosidase [Microlunatus panaciterrae]